MDVLPASCRLRVTSSSDAMLTFYIGNVFLLNMPLLDFVRRDSIKPRPNRALAKDRRIDSSQDFDATQPRRVVVEATGIILNLCLGLDR
jgi:hypothetical protein